MIHGRRRRRPDRLATVLTLAVSVLTVRPATAQVGAPAGAMLVVPFENARREARLYWLGEGSAVLLTDNLRALGVKALTREERLRAFQHLSVPPVATLTHATVIKLGQLVGATHVVVGSFEVAETRLTIRARAIRLDTGRLLEEVVERGVLDDALAIYARAARRLVPESKADPTAIAEGHPPIAAFEQYIKGLLAATPAAQLSYLDQALKLDPGFERAKLAQWDVYDEQAEHTRALAIARQVAATDALSRQARFREALSLLNLSRNDEAVGVLTALNDAKPDPALLNNLGVAQVRRPKVAGDKTAASYFREAASIDPEDPDLFFNAGYAAWFEKDVKGAIASLREAVRRDPADDQAHYVLGVALQTAGNTTEGTRERDLAKKLSSEYAEWEAKQPSGTPVPRGLERLRTDIDASESVRIESVLVASGQREQRQLAAFHLDRGRRLFQQEKDVEAIAELRRAVYLAPYHVEAHVLLGRIHLRAGRTQEAIDALTIATWSDPSNEEARKLLESVK